MTAEPQVTTLEPRVCPDCKYRTDRATNPEEEITPSPGDIAICLNCGCLSFYEDGMTQKKMTDEEYQALEPETRTQISRYEDARRTAMKGVIGSLAEKQHEGLS